MPRIKRWFPVSHDINADPEVWELTDRFGDRALRVWLEILSVSDRNESEVRGDYEYVVRSLSGKCQTTTKQVRAILQYAQSKGWLHSDMPIRTCNYAKYHKSREPKEIPEGNYQAPLPSETSETSETYTNIYSSSIAAAPPSESASSTPETPASAAQQKGPETGADDPTWTGLSDEPLTTTTPHAGTPAPPANTTPILPCEIQWPENLHRIRAVLVELEVLDAMADPQYWKAIDAWVESTGLDIFYLDELKGYVANQRSKTPHTRGWHKDLKSGFRNWLSQTKFWREKDAQRATIQQRYSRK